MSSSIKPPLFSSRMFSSRNISVTGMAIAFTMTGLITPSYALQFPDTGGRGGPTSTTGGGVRGECRRDIDSEGLITALMPTNGESQYEHTFVDETVTLFFYISQELAEKTGEIYAEDAMGEIVVEQELSLSQTPGLVSVSFPAMLEDGTALTPNQPYRWIFSVICDPQDRSVDLYTTGFFTRVDNASSQPMSVERIELDDRSLATANDYAQARIWQESFQVLDSLKCNHSSEWTEFLTSVGVEDAIAQSTLAQCSQ